MRNRSPDDAPYYRPTSLQPTLVMLIKVGEDKDGGIPVAAHLPGTLVSLMLFSLNFLGDGHTARSRCAVAERLRCSWLKLALFARRRHTVGIDRPDQLQMRCRERRRAGSPL